MMRRRVVFGKIISFVLDAFFPIHKELALAYAIADPIEAHIDSLGALLFDAVVGDSSSGAVIGLNCGRWLWMAKFLEADAQRTGFFAVVISGGKFGFGRTGEDFSHNGADDVDGAVGRGVGIIWQRCFGGIGGHVAEKVVASGTRASKINREIGGVAGNEQDHATGVISNDGVRMGCSIIEKLGEGNESGLGTVGLLRCQFTNSG